MTDVVMPQMGESITEGTLTKWLKKPGEKVGRDEPLFEISTDKVDTEIPSPAAGTLAEVLVEEGKTVAINTVVAKIDEAGEVAGAAAAVEAEPEPAPPPDLAPSPAAAVGPTSPLVRSMAREHNIDLSQVKGTGGGGRVTKHDVEAYLSSRPAAPAPPPAAPVEPPAAPVEAAPVEAAPPPRAEPRARRVETMSNMRAKIAERMVFSKRTSPHVTTVHKCDMTTVVRVRDRLKAQFKERYGVSLTYLPFVTRAVAQALRAFPIVNASVKGNKIFYHNEISIGVAVALDSGLIVPVIRNADEMSVVGLQRAITDLAQRARSRRLKPGEVQGGTFSITNFGAFGGLFAIPIINQPQVAILAVGSVEKEPVVIDDAIAIRSICHLTLTFDHRLIDGAVGVQFTERVRGILENWSEQVL